MAKANKKEACSHKRQTIHTRDLPLSCPPENATLWNAHPKIYLPIEKTKEAVCPYCGTRYFLKSNA